MRMRAAFVLEASAGEFQFRLCAIFDLKMALRWLLGFGS
jgi:hypothetical protein